MPREVGRTWVAKTDMGNYTWIVKCISNGPADEPVFDIIQCMGVCMKKLDYWFDTWAETLAPQQRNTYDTAKELLWKTDHPDVVCETLMKDPEFPRKISLKELMTICNNQKFYGYLDQDLRHCMQIFGKCLPPDQFCMMIAIYEGWGPVAMGWVGQDFKEMMGFDNYKFADTYLLENPSTTLEDYLKANEVGDDPSWETELKRTYFAAMDLVQTVINAADQVDWSTTDPLDWLGRRGFEICSRHTQLKEYGMMCNQQ